MSSNIKKVCCDVADVMGVVILWMEVKGKESKWQGEK